MVLCMSEKMTEKTRDKKKSKYGYFVFVTKRAVTRQEGLELEKYLRKWAEDNNIGTKFYWYDTNPRFLKTMDVRK